MNCENYSYKKKKKKIPENRTKETIDQEGKSIDSNSTWVAYEDNETIHLRDIKDRFLAMYFENFIYKF